jgi:hypothetical protein
MAAAHGRRRRGRVLRRTGPKPAAPVCSSPRCEAPGRLQLDGEAATARIGGADRGNGGGARDGAARLGFGARRRRVLRVAGRRGTGGGGAINRARLRLARGPEAAARRVGLGPEAEPETAGGRGEEADKAGPACRRREAARGCGERSWAALGRKA